MVIALLSPCTIALARASTGRRVHAVARLRFCNSSRGTCQRHMGGSIADVGPHQPPRPMPKIAAGSRGRLGCMFPYVTREPCTVLYDR